MRVLITGSRSLNNERSKYFIYFILKNRIDKEKDIVIHGGAPGVDMIAEEWCEYNKVQTKVVRPIHKNQSIYYLHRNAEMIGICDKVIAFWDNKSRGTQFTIDYARERGVPVEVLSFNQGENDEKTTR